MSKYAEGYQDGLKDIATALAFAGEDGVRTWLANNLRDQQEADNHNVTKLHAQAELTPALWERVLDGTLGDEQEAEEARRDNAHEA